MKQRLQSLESVLTQLQPSKTAPTTSGNAVKDKELMHQLKQSRKHLQSLQQEQRDLKDDFVVFKAKSGFKSVSAKMKVDTKPFVVPRAVIKPMKGLCAWFIFVLFSFCLLFSLLFSSQYLLHYVPPCSLFDLLLNLFKGTVRDF